MCQENVLSLSVLSADYALTADDDRTYYRLEVAWDSSLHNSQLLNRVTPAKDLVFITITCYIDLDNCVEPVCITKDLCLVFYPRDANINPTR